MCSLPIGKQTNILQLNIEGISRSKAEVLGRLLHDNDVDVAVVQETHCATPEDLQKRAKVPGYTLAAAEYSGVHGIATYVRSSMVSMTNVTQNSQHDGVYTCTVRINSLHVTNVYKPPAAELHQSSLTVLPHPAIYIGDFNAHHQDWGYEESDTNGEELVEWADRNSIHLVFDAKDRKIFSPEPIVKNTTRTYHLSAVTQKAYHCSHPELSFLPFPGANTDQFYLL